MKTGWTDYTKFTFLTRRGGPDRENDSVFGEIGQQSPIIIVREILELRHIGEDEDPRSA